MTTSTKNELKEELLKITTYDDLLDFMTSNNVSLAPSVVFQNENEIPHPFIGKPRYRDNIVVCNPSDFTPYKVSGFTMQPVFTRNPYEKLGVLVGELP